MLERMIRAARLETDLYEEVEADKTATGQALMVVVLVAVASGIGGLGATGNVAGLIFGVLFGLVNWALWAYVTFLIGTTILNTPQTQADWGELARTTGFAQSPGILRILGVIPVLGTTIFAVISVWQLATMVIAIRQALDYTSTWRAAGVAVIGFIVLAALQSVLLFL